jgi:FMN phosphatase YigB (HAD superfamily)
MGVEKSLATELSVPEEEIWSGLSGKPLENLFLGNISEDIYLNQIIQREDWRIDNKTIKSILRDNFHNHIHGPLELLKCLDGRLKLILHSDHAREWIAYIKTIHPFLDLFHHTLFSFDLKRLKDDPEAFTILLEVLSIPPQRCLFIDDNPENIKSASSAGLLGIRFENAVQLADELENREVL